MTAIVRGSVSAFIDAGNMEVIDEQLPAIEDKSADDIVDADPRMEDKPEHKMQPDDPAPDEASSKRIDSQERSEEGENDED